MLPANEARNDLNKIRGTTGLAAKPGLKPVARLDPMRPAVGGAKMGGMSAPTGFSGGNRMVPPSLSPAGPHMPAPQTTPPAPVPSAIPNTPGAPTPISHFGPGNDLLSSQINPGMSGVNRTQLAQNQLKSWDEQDAPRLAGEMRLVGQNAAKFGRIGAGMTTNDLTGLEATHARNRNEVAANLASGLASDTVNDARSNNDELRTERDYQTGRSDKAQSDNINQRVLEDQLLNSRFGRAQGLMGAGYADSPTGVLEGASGRAGSDAQGAIAGGVDLLRSRQKPQQTPDYTALLEALTKQQSGSS